MRLEGPEKRDLRPRCEIFRLVRFEGPKKPMLGSTAKVRDYLTSAIRVPQVRILMEEGSFFFREKCGLSKRLPRAPRRLSFQALLEHNFAGDVRCATCAAKAAKAMLYPKGSMYPI